MAAVVGDRRPGGQRDNATVEAKYELVGSRTSYFTQKMQAALQWYFPKDHVFVVKSADLRENIEKRSGTHQVPVLITPENWCIADSTPLLTLLDARLPERKFYPNGLVGLLTAVMEEYFDEWSARWCIETRWMTGDETSLMASGAMIKEQGLSPEQGSKQQQTTIAWGRRAARAIGVASEIQKREAEAELVRIFGKFEEHLAAGNNFTFGQVPTAVDTVMMGGLRAHFLHDEPYPKALLKGLDRVHKWTDSLMSTTIDASGKATSGLTAENLPPYVQLILTEMGGGFKNFVLGNATAYKEGKKAFVVNVYGEEVSYLFRPYVEKSRRMLIQKLNAHLATCSTQEKADFTKIMETYKLSDLYGPQLASSL